MTTIVTIRPDGTRSSEDVPTAVRISPTQTVTDHGLYIRITDKKEN